MVTEFQIYQGWRTLVIANYRAKIKVIYNLLALSQLSHAIGTFFP